VVSVYSDLLYFCNGSYDVDLSLFLLDSHAHEGTERKVSYSAKGTESWVSLYTVKARTLMSFSGLFLRYPSDADKHLLARQTGLSRNQVRPLHS